MYLQKRKFVNEINEEIERNRLYINANRGTKDGAMYLGREIALAEVVERINTGMGINCERTTYMVEWIDGEVEKALKEILLTLKSVKKGKEKELTVVVEQILDKYEIA